MGVKLLWVGLTFIMALPHVFQAPILFGMIGGILMLIGAVLLVLDR